MRGEGGKRSEGGIFTTKWITIYYLQKKKPPELMFVIFLILKNLRDLKTKICENCIFKIRL